MYKRGSIFLYKHKLFKFKDTDISFCIVKIFSFNIVKVIKKLITPCSNLKVINSFNFIPVLYTNEYTWKIIINELKDNIKDVKDITVVVLEFVVESMFIPVVSSNNPSIIPFIISGSWSLANIRFGISENIIKYPKIIPNVLKEFSVDVSNISNGEDIL